MHLASGVQRQHVNRMCMADAWVETKLARTAVKASRPLVGFGGLDGTMIKALNILSSIWARINYYISNIREEMN